MQQTVQITRPAPQADRKILVVVAALAILLIGGRELHRRVVSQMNRALRSGNWQTADRLSPLWSSASPMAIRGAMQHCLLEHNYGALKHIVRQCPHLNLSLYIREECGDVDDSTFNAYISNSNLSGQYSDIADPEMLRTLIGCGANPNTTLEKDEGDTSRTVLGVLLLIKSRESKPKFLDKLKQMEAVLRKAGGKLDLFDAARFGDTERLQEMLRSGANPNDKDWLERPVAYLAAINNQIESERILKAAGADMNSGANEPSGIGKESPLMAAERCGFTKLSEMLIENGARVAGPADPQSKDSEIAPLNAAALYGDVAHLKYLVKHGVIIDTKTMGGTGVLNRACTFTIEPSRRLVLVMPPRPQPTTSERESTQVPALKYLLSIGCDTNSRDHYGSTPIIEAVWSARLTKILIDHGANPNAALSNGVTPLMAAADGGHVETVRTLLNAHADVRLLDWADGSALGIAMAADVSEASKTKIVTLLKQYGAHLCLPEAVKVGDEAELHWWAAHGSKASDRGRDRAPLLLIATHNGHAKMVEELLSMGADVNAADPRGWTALMVAAGDGRSDLASLLLKHGARLDLKTDAGSTAYQIASKHRHEALLNILDTTNPTAAY